MSVQIEIKVNDAELRGLATILAQLGRLKPALADIGEIVREQATMAFENEKSPGGAAWRPSLRAMGRGRGKKGKAGGKTLSDTGLLKKIDVSTMPEAVMVGTNVVYAAIHQFGGQAGRGRRVKLPARPYLPDERSIDTPEILATLRQHIERAMA